EKVLSGDKFVWVNVARDHYDSPDYPTSEDSVAR
ncbi:MAG: hypothetical protein ACI92B_002222, partial [Marinobacter maritimus]